MLLNYTELALIVNPSRYDTPCTVTFQQALYKLPQEHGWEMHCWLVKNFVLELDPPTPDQMMSLESLMLNSLMGQAHTLLQSIRRSEELGVLGAAFNKRGQEWDVTDKEVLNVIQQDLFAFPGFKQAWNKWQGTLAPELYSCPTPPSPH